MKESSIVDRIKTLQEKAGITQKELADALDVRQNSLSRYLSEKNQLPVEVVSKLADYFDVSCDYLIRGYDANNTVIGNETGLDNGVIDKLRYWHKNKPWVDGFTNYLLDSVNYAVLLQYLTLFVDIDIKAMPAQMRMDGSFEEEEKALAKKFWRFATLEQFGDLIDGYAAITKTKYVRFISEDGGEK